MSPGYVYFLSALGGLILQGSLLRDLLPFGIVPNFIIILVVHVSFFWQRQYTVWFVFLLGLLADLFGSTMILGPSASAAVLVYLGITVISKRLYMDSAMTLVVVVFVASLFNRLVSQLIVNQFIEADSLLVTIFNHAPLEALGSVVFAQVLFMVFRKLGLGRKPGSSFSGLTWAG